MMGRPKTSWIFLLSLILVLTAFYGVRGRDAQSASNFVGTQTCIDCHNTWLDNDPPTGQVVSGEVSFDYPPLNLASSRTGDPWYTIPEGWTASVHNIPAFNLTTTDEVPCEACHGSGQAHFGIGAIPVPIPGTKVCIGCHNPTHGFDPKAFLKTAHANPNINPGKFFDQPFFGVVQAKITAKSPVSNAPVGTLLFKQGTFGPTGDAVSRNARIEECSTCHQYAMQYPQFSPKIAQGNLPPKPEVSCGACHDAHIVAPDGLEPAIVTSTVVVNQVTGSGAGSPVSVSPVPGRKVSYINNKPYPIADNGAMDTNNGTWTRGSAINRPQTLLMKGTSGVVNSGGNCSLITLSGDSFVESGGFLKNQVKEDDTFFISGVTTATAVLPSSAKLAGQSVTVQATLDMAGFQVSQIIDEKNLVVDPPVVANATVSYVKTDGTTGTLAVAIPFCGLSVSFEIRDMHTNTVDLCGACHTQGAYKFTKWGKEANGSLVNLSPTHNINVAGQYKTSGHALESAPAFEEFNAFVYGSSHQAIYPFDMSITGSGVAGSYRNKGNTTFNLLNVRDPVNVFLIAKGNTSQPVINNGYACYQCHNGIGTIDYLQDIQGTSAARILWGDATLVCITCHDPHKDESSSNGKGPNIRVPVKLSYNTTYFTSATNPRGGINKMMDGTDIPSGVGTGILCLFCHQGRESGYTVYKNITNNGGNPYTDPNALIKPTGISFQNPHYLESGAILWSKNTFEYLTVSGNPTPNKYSTGIPQHQDTNCAGCHMGEASANDFEGGHTWRPRIEVCQQCHGPVKTFQDIEASADFNGNGVVESAFAEIGTINPDTGLFGQLKAALAAKGIFYNPDSYPYFFNAAGGSFTAWTSNTLTAAFNLSFLYKAGNCAYVHNVFYSAQILQDSLKAVNAPVKPWVRPAGDRNATDYRTIVIP
jgi:hypothetical protein